MNKMKSTLMAVFVGLSCSTAVIYNKEYTNRKPENTKYYSLATDAESTYSVSESKSIDQSDYSISPEITDAVAVLDSLSYIENSNSVSSENQSAAAPPQQSPRMSRGGKPPVDTNQQTVQSLPKTELLDWWKNATYAFPVNAEAVIKDLYTGKTFKVKRTMGTNHADAEALTKQDSETIKSIWGGFSWDRRPVHVIINGRVLAASMSAMPHAGLDSAPAYATINNRSGEYGRGENLDVIKNNGMDGHFDIHFLNSTRHKDGKQDPQHQANIKISANK